MPAPAGATFQGDDGVWYAWDEVSGEFFPAVSTPVIQASSWPAPIKNVLDTAVPNFTTMANQAQKPGESIFDTALRILPNIAATKGQIDLINVNIERAKKGLPPIDLSAYSGLGVNVGLSAGTQQLVTYAGLALVGLVLLNMATRK